MTNDRTFTVDTDDDGIRLDRWFKRHQPDVSFNIVSRWARTGQLRVDGKRAAPGDRIEAGQTIRIPPAEAQPAPSGRPQPRRDPLTEEETEFVRSLVIEQSRDAFVLNKPPGLATQGGTKTHNHLDRLLGGLEDDEANRPKLVHRLDKDTSGVLLVARSARSAAFFSRVLCRPHRQEGLLGAGDRRSARRGRRDRPAAGQAAGDRRREDARRPGKRAGGEDPLADDRPRRQPRRLAGAAAADRPHPPASRASGGDRLPDRRRRQIWRHRRPFDRRHQPQAAPPRAAAEDRRARGQGDRRHRRFARPFRAEPRHAGLLAAGRRHDAARPAEPVENARGQAAAGRGRRQDPPARAPRRAARPRQHAERQAEAKAQAQAQAKAGEQARHLRLRRDARRQRRDHLPRAWASVRHPRRRSCRRPATAAG